MFSLTMLTNRIALVTFTDKYEMAMTFLRAQEFYECPNERFRGKTRWTIMEYMDWYVKEYGRDTFTYPTDWSGFNIPSNIIDEVTHDPTLFKDWNDRDRLLKSMHAFIQELAGRKYYLIAALKGSDAIEHELAHALYYTDSEYRCRMRDIFLELSEQGHRETINKVRKCIRDSGYHENVVEDELYAYLATGLPQTMRVEIDAGANSLAYIQQKFEEVFSDYSKKIQM